MSISVFFLIDWAQVVKIQVRVYGHCSQKGRIYTIIWQKASDPRRNTVEGLPNLGGTLAALLIYFTDKYEITLPSVLQFTRMITFNWFPLVECLIFFLILMYFFQSRLSCECVITITWFFLTHGQNCSSLKLFPTSHLSFAF